MATNGDLSVACENRAILSFHLFRPESAEGMVSAAGKLSIRSAGLLKYSIRSRKAAPASRRKKLHRTPTPMSSITINTSIHFSCRDRSFNHVNSLDFKPVTCML
jgi:hypothetical protein